MNQNENQSRLSRRATNQSQIHREYPFRKSEKKNVYKFDGSSDDEPDSVESPIRVYRSWSLDPQTNDSDPGYSSLNESKLSNKTVGHSNPASVNTDYQSEPDNKIQPPLPKVILKRSYSKIGENNDDDDITSYLKHQRGRPRKHLKFGHKKETSNRQQQLSVIKSRGRPFKRSRGRPRKHFESESVNAFSTISRTLHKVNANPEFFYGEEYNFVTDVAPYSDNDKLVKVNVPLEAKDTLQKQVQLKRRLSCDKGVSTDSVKDDLETEPVKQVLDKQCSNNATGEIVAAHADANNEPISDIKKKPGCQFCAFNRQVENSGGARTSKGDQTINIDRCLNWAYQLSKNEWQDLLNSLSLLKSKYPVLKILFKRNPVIHLVDIKHKQLDEEKQNSMASKHVLKDKKGSKSNLVDPRVVPWSISLINNGTGRKGIDKIFKKSKNKTLKQFTNKRSHSVSKSRHDLDFKQRLKEACKPKPKKMEKAGQSGEKIKFGFSQGRDLSVKSLKEYYTVKESAITSKSNSDSSNRGNDWTANDGSTNQNKSTESYPDISSQYCSSPGTPGSPIGSPGPPHLEKEMVRNMDNCYGNSEMEILKMNDFEIEICRDDVDQSMPEVLDMRTGVRERTEYSAQDNYQNSSLPLLTEEKPTGTSDGTKANEGVERTHMGSYISRYSHLTENLEVNVDEVSAADVNSFPSPSNLVIQNVRSLNEEYNEATDFSHNEPNIYNQRILEMLDGEIFDTNVIDATPLDLVKTTKQMQGSVDIKLSSKQTVAHYNSDSDETMVYSDASEENLELDNESEFINISNQMSPRLKALKSTKNSIPVSIEDSSSNDSDSAGSSSEANDMLSKPSHNRSQMPECLQSKAKDEVFKDKTKSGTNEKSCSNNKQKSTKIVAESVNNFAVQERNKGFDQDITSKQQQSFTENEKAGLEIQESGTENDVRHISTGLEFRSDVSGHENGLNNMTGDTDEYDGHALVINETTNEMDDAQEDDDAEMLERKTKQPKSGKSLSFVRNLGKNKQLRDFMHKEKERRRSLNKDGKMPKLLLNPKSRKTSNEDPEDLPQILPPKRRQRAQKSQSLEETRGLGKPANLERIMADFPKHNWLFDKYNNVSKEDAMNGPGNQQNQAVYSEASAPIETATVMSSTSGSPLPSHLLVKGHTSAGHRSMTSSTSGQPVQSQPLVERHNPARHQIKIPVTSGGHQAVSRNSQEVYAAHGAGNESRKSLSSAKVQNMTDSSGNVAQNLARDPVVSPEKSKSLPAPGRFVSTFTPCSSAAASWKPVKEHDPTLASLTLDTSPTSFIPLDEIDNSAEMPVHSETLSVNEHAQKVCIVSEETALASVKRLSLVCGFEQNPKSVGNCSQVHDSGQVHDNRHSNSGHKTDMSNLYASSCLTAQVHTKKGKLNSDRRELILDRKPEEKQFNPGKSQENLDQPSIQVPKSVAVNDLTNAQGQASQKSGTSEYRLGSLKPETIEAIKIGNPGLVESQLPATTQKLGQAVEKCIYINDDDPGTDTVQVNEKTNMGVGAKASSDIEKPLPNTLNEMEEHLAMLDREHTVMSKKAIGKYEDVNLQGSQKLNDEDNDVNLSNDKENVNENYGSSQTRQIFEEDYLTSTIMKDDKVKNACYPLNMKQTTLTDLPVKKSSGMRQPSTAISHLQTSTEVWRDDLLPELIPYESGIGETEEIMLPLDLCINRNVTENSFANYRKHHPPPVQLVHPQIQKPPSSEAVTMATDIARVQAEVTEEIPKEDENEEESLPINVIQNNETSREDISDLSAIENRPEGEIDTSVRILNGLSDIPGKISELQTTVPAGTLVSTEEVCEAPVNITAAKVAPSSAPVPSIQKFMRPVAALSQQRPVIVHPVQQVNSTPRAVRAQMIQPAVTVHSVTPTAAELLQRQRQGTSQFMSNIPQRLSNSQTFQPIPQTRHAQTIGSGNQAQSNFGNIQLVIPAGQLLVPIQSPTIMQANALPMLQTYGTHSSQARQNSKPRKPRTIRPKSDEIPPKKQKIDQQESELQKPSDSLSGNGRELDNSNVVNTSVSGENKFIAKNEPSNLSSESFVTDFTKNRDKDHSFLEESGNDKSDDSSDELMDDVDDDLLNEMEEYKKLKEERKRKEKEEMEMRKKIMEMRKVAKAKKRTVLKPESKTQEQREDLGDLKSDHTSVSPSGGPKKKVDEEKSLSNEINEGINSFLGKECNKECPNEDRSAEVIADLNVPLTGSTTDISAHNNTNARSYNSLKEEIGEIENQFPLITDLDETRVTDVGLDLSVKQQTSRSEQSFSSTMKNQNEGYVNSKNVLPETDVQQANSIVTVSAAPQIHNYDSGSIKTPRKQDIIIESENLPSSQGYVAKAAETSIPVTKGINKSSLAQVEPQIQNNDSSSIKTTENQCSIIESENLLSNHGHQAKEAEASISVTKDIIKSSFSQVAPKIQNNTEANSIDIFVSAALPIQINDSSSITTPKKQDIIDDSDQGCHEKSSGTPIPFTKDNIISSLNQSQSLETTSMSSLSHSVIDTHVSVGDSLNLIQSKNLVTDIELEQRPYSPPLLKPRPISWLERMREAASTLGTDNKHIATTKTTSAYRLAKSPSYVEKHHAMRRTKSSGTVYYSNSSTATSPDHATKPKRMYTVSPKPDDYKEFTATPMLDNVKKVNRTSGTANTDVKKDFPTISSGTNINNVNNMTPTGTDMIDTKDPITDNILRNSIPCDEIIETCDLENNKATEMSGSINMNRPLSNRNIIMDISRPNEAIDKSISSVQNCKTTDSSFLDTSEVSGLTQEDAVPTNINDRNNERLDTEERDSRGGATISNKADSNVTIDSEEVESVDTEMIGIKAYVVNAAKNVDKASTVDSYNTAVDDDINSTAVDLTAKYNEKQMDINMTSVTVTQTESFISDIEDNNADSPVVQTDPKEFVITDPSETENMATDTENKATNSLVDFAPSSSSSLNVNISASSINAPGEVPAVELLDLSTKHNSNTALQSPRCSSVPSTSTVVSSTLCTNSCLSVLSSVHETKCSSKYSTTGDTTCTSSYSTTGVLMSVMMSVGVQPSEKNRPKSASSAEGIDATYLSGSGNSETIPKTKSMVFPRSVGELVSKAPTNGPGILQADGYPTPIDYSMKPLPTIKTEENGTESLSPNCKTLNLMQRSPCSSNSSFLRYTTTSSSVNISPSGYSTLSRAVQDRLNNGKISHDIPVAHSARPKPEKVPKGAKARPAHNNCSVTSMKPLIKLMNRTMCQVPEQVQQSCPYFKKTLQYNWSPSPKDTYRSKLIRRETPIPPLAHNQKPFGIAGTLITPAGRFVRKRSRSVELKRMPYGPSNAQSHYSGNQQLGSRIHGGHYSSTSYPQMHHHSPNKGPILPPIRAHIHLEGTVDTVTVTNIQKPGAVTPTSVPRLSPRDYSKKCDVVDLTNESRESDKCDSWLVQRDSQLTQRDSQLVQSDSQFVLRDNQVVGRGEGQLDDDEKQIQQELSEAVAKRQKMENELADSSVQRKTMAEPGEVINIGASDQDSADYNQDCEDIVARRRRRARSHSFSFQMNRPVLPTGAYYQPMQAGQTGQGHQRVGPPNITLNQNYNPTHQEQPRSYLDVETNSLRSVLQAAPEDIQAHLRQRQNQSDARVPPLMKLRDAARMSQTISQQLPQPPVQPYSYVAQQETSTARSPSGNNYPFQPHGMMRPQGSQAQQPPGLVNHYLVPARNTLLLPRAPTVSMTGPHPMQRQYPMIAPKQSYGATGMTPPQGAGMISQQGVGLSPPRHRYPPPPYQRNGSGQGQYGQMQGVDIRCDQGQVSPQGQYLRGQAPNSPNYQGYNSQGQGPRSHNQDSRHLMPSPQQYQVKGQQGQLPSPGNHGNQIRYSPGQPVRDYRYSPVKVQGQTSRSFMNMPQGHTQGQTSGVTAMQDHQVMNAPANLPTVDKYGNDVRCQGQEHIQRSPQQQIQRSPQQDIPHQMHSDTSHQAWSHSGLSPQRQRQHYSMPQERITPPAYPTYSTQHPTMHQSNKPYPVTPGHAATSYSSMNQQTSVTMATAIQGQGHMGISQNIMTVGTQIIPDQNHVRNQNVPYSVYINRKPMTLQNNHRQKSGSQNIMYQDTRVPSTQQQLPRQQLLQEVPQYQANQIVNNERQLPVRHSHVVDNSINSGQGESSRQPILSAGHGQSSHYKQQLVSNQQIVKNSGNEFSNNRGHDIQPQVQQQQQQYGNNSYKQEEAQHDHMLPSNQGHARNPVSINVEPQVLEQSQPLPDNQCHQRTLADNQGHQRTLPKNEGHQRTLPDNQGHQRNVAALTSPRSQGQSDPVEVIEVEEDDFPHLQQVHSSCVLCGKFSLYLCSNCKEVWYCSPACQMTHWQTHSAVCQGDGT